MRRDNRPGEGVRALGERGVGNAKASKLARRGGHPGAGSRTGGRPERAGSDRWPRELCSRLGEVGRGGGTSPGERSDGIKFTLCVRILPALGGACASEGRDARRRRLARARGGSGRVGRAGAPGGQRGRAWWASRVSTREFPGSELCRAFTLHRTAPPRTLTPHLQPRRASEGPAQGERAHPRRAPRCRAGRSGARSAIARSREGRPSSVVGHRLQSRRARCVSVLTPGVVVAGERCAALRHVLCFRARALWETRGRRRTAARGGGSARRVDRRAGGASWTDRSLQCGRSPPTDPCQPLLSGSWTDAMIPRWRCPTPAQFTPRTDAFSSVSRCQHLRAGGCCLLPETNY